MFLLSFFLTLTRVSSVFENQPFPQSPGKRSKSLYDQFEDRCFSLELTLKKHIFQNDKTRFFVFLNCGNLNRCQDNFVLHSIKIIFFVEGDGKSKYGNILNIGESPTCIIRKGWKKEREEKHVMIFATL